MKQIKPVLKVTAFLLLTLYLSARGWSSSRDIEKLAFIMMIGADTRPGGGFSVHHNIAIPQALGGSGDGRGGGSGEGGGKDTVLHVTADAPTISEARHIVQAKVENPLFFGHLQAAVVGEELAKQGVRQVLDVMLRNAELRRKAWFIVAEETADKVLKVQPRLEKLPSLYLNRALEMENYLKMIPMLRFGEFMTRESSPGQEPVAIIVKPEKESITISGLAVFKGDKMVGKLSSEEMHNFFLAAMGKGFHPVRIPCPTGNGELVYYITGAKRTVKPHVEGNKVSFSVLVQVEGNIQEKSSKASLRNEEYLRSVETAVASKLQRDVRLVLRRFQREFQSDAYGFGDIVHARFPKVWQAIDWEKEFPDVPINIRVEAKVRRLGMGAN